MNQNIKVMGIIFLLFGFVIFVKYLSTFSVEGVDSIKAQDNKTIYQGLNEVCELPHLSLECQEGLKCVLYSFDKSGSSGVCLPEGTKLNKTQILREDYDGNWQKQKLKEYEE
jgi:hypothetical protein